MNWRPPAPKFSGYRVQDISPQWKGMEFHFKIIVWRQISRSHVVRTTSSSSCFRSAISTVLIIVLWDDICCKTHSCKLIPLEVALHRCLDILPDPASSMLCNLFKTLVDNQPSDLRTLIPLPCFRLDQRIVTLHWRTCLSLAAGEILLRAKPPFWSGDLPCAEIAARTFPYKKVSMRKPLVSYRDPDIVSRSSKCSLFFRRLTRTPPLNEVDLDASEGSCHAYNFIAAFCSDLFFNGLFSNASCSFPNLQNFNFPSDFYRTKKERGMNIFPARYLPTRSQKVRSEDYHVRYIRSVCDPQCASWQQVLPYQ